MARSKAEHIGTISKLDLLRSAKGPQQHISGTGAWRDKRQQPKGGRSAATRRAIDEN